MRYDGYYSDGVVATDRSRRQRRRREICRSFTCISPWFIFRRWFNGNKSMGRKWERETMEGHFDINRTSGVTKGSRNQESFPSPGEDVSEEVKEATFNLGVGFGLIYLVRNELNKMVELRRKMEFLIQNFQTQIQNPDENPPFIHSKSRISSALSNTGVIQAVYPEAPDLGEHLSSQDIERPETGFGSNMYRREKSLRMDQLEAELEAEFDHLQLQMDAKVFFKYSRQQFPEIEESVPEWSHNTCYEEVYEQHEEFSNNECYYGVPPRELERKLHELLESRQQERISELESALDYAMDQLHDKERELSWWKDTARLVSQNLPAVPGLLRHVKQEFEVSDMGKSVVKNPICGVHAN